MNFAPIILFVYNRLDHTQKTLDALKTNLLSEESELYIFSDGPKHNEDSLKVEEVRNYLKGLSGFKQITIIESEENKGLANSVISGVTAVINKYERAIILEDDIITSKYFLKFMNDALETYKDDEKIGSISGFLYPIGKVESNFFLQQGSSWGWATWKRSWDLFESDGQKLLDELNSKNLAYKFDFDDAGGFVSMLKDQVAGKNSSWAIRFYASLFVNNKLHYFPRHSMSINIGFDNSGTHCGSSNFYDTMLYNEQIAVEKQEVIENSNYRNLMVKYLNKNNRIGNDFIYKEKKGDKRVLCFLGLKFSYKKRIR